jgi:hypothetical protein
MSTDFPEEHGFHLQGRKEGKAGNQHAAGSKQLNSLYSAGTDCTENTVPLLQYNC